MAIFMQKSPLFNVLSIIKQIYTRVTAHTKAFIIAEPLSTKMSLKAGSTCIGDFTAGVSVQSSAVWSTWTLYTEEGKKTQHYTYTAS